MAEQKTKPQLHQSQLAMLYRCGEQFRRVVLEGHREPPAIPQVIGRSAHEVTAQNLNRKANKGSLMSLDEVKDAASDAFIREWELMPVVLSEAEMSIGLDKVKGSSKDRTVEMSVIHAKEIAPKVKPAPGGVEWKWVIECQGYPYDLSGQIDVKESNHDIRDGKFRAKQITQREVDTSEQLTVYAMAEMIIDGVMPEKVWLDGVKLAEAGKKSSFVSFESKRTEADFHVFKNRFEQAVDVIEKGAFTPASPTDWWCSERFCGFAADGSCPYFNRGRKTFLPPTRRGMSDVKKRVIQKGTEEWIDATR